MTAFPGAGGWSRKGPRAKRRDDLRSRSRFWEAFSSSGFCRQCRAHFSFAVKAVEPPRKTQMTRGTEADIWTSQMAEHSCSCHLLFRACRSYGASPYMDLSWPWAKARAGGISILPPMISIYAPDLLARAAFIASSSSPSVVTRAVYQFAHPSAFGNSAYFQGARSL